MKPYSEKEIPCECGFTYEKNSDEFEIYHLLIASINGRELPRKPVMRCKSCKTISKIETALNLNAT